uniref:Uncharacterized protein n=1 Tax=viral metagenome TaxID=1070528 RepID=A0A6C0K4M3_9ZZZZ
MEDTCNPYAKLKLQPYRIYSILIPIVGLIFILESVFVFMSIPESLGNALTLKGPFPQLKTHM